MNASLRIAVGLLVLTPAALPAQPPAPRVSGRLKRFFRKVGDLVFCGCLHEELR
jgi:hypothetical protein